MVKKIVYLAIVAVLLAAVLFLLGRNSTGSRSEIQKLRAQLYDLQKELEKKTVSTSEIASVKEEETKVAAVVTAPSQTPPSEVRRSSEAKLELPAEDSNDFAATLADLQEVVKEEASKGAPPEDVTENQKEVSETTAQAEQKGIDMSDVDAIIREAERKLVAQYGEEILERETKEEVKTAGSEKITETKEIVAELTGKTDEKIKESVPETPVTSEKTSYTSVNVQNDLPGATPVKEVQQEIRRPVVIASDTSLRGELTPVHSDYQGSFIKEATAEVSSTPRQEVKATAPAQTAPARSVSLRPASEVIVPLTAREEVEKDLQKERDLREVPKAPKRIERKNYNAIGKRTMADIMRDGL